MKLFTAGVLILLNVHLVNGQETQSISKKSNGFREEYTALATDKKLKHGPYKKYKGKDELVEEGTFDNNKRTGEWKFYSDGQLEQSYNFTSQELTYVKKSEQSTRAVIDLEIKEIQLDTPPLYLGSKPALNKELNRIMTYPMQALRMGIEGKVLVSAWITETNQFTEIKIVKGIMEDINNEVIKGFTNTERNWIAGTKNGKKVKAEIIFIVEFKLHDGGGKTITLL